MPVATEENGEPFPVLNGVKHYATFPVNGHLHPEDDVVPASSKNVSFADSTRSRGSSFIDTSQPFGVQTTLPPLQVNTSRRVPSMGIHEDQASGSQSASRARIRTWSDDPKVQRFPRISKPVELMRSSYDCIVIGSGYGGGVAASRMARAGESVCLLERGKEKWPGEYPSGTGECLEQLHYSGEVCPKFLPKSTAKGGDPTGMYHLIFGNGQNALVGNGE